MRKILGRSPRGFLGFIAFAALLSLAVTGGAGAQATADDVTAQDSIVEITVANRAAVDVLIAADIDLVEYLRENDDGTVTVNAVVNDEERAALEAAGYTIGATVEDFNNYLARIAELEASYAAEERSHEAAETGEVSGGGSLQAAGLRSSALVQAAPELVVNRVDYFQNYAGWFLSVEVFDSLVNGTGSTGPTVSFSWKTATGSYGSATTIPRYIDSDPTPDVYMYNRILVRIGPASPPYGSGTAPVPPAMIRVATSTTGVPTVEAEVRPWVASPLTSTGPNFSTQYFTGYMNSYQTRAQIESLAAEFTGLTQLITLPNLTNGYQRKSFCVMNGTSACNSSGSSSTPYIEAVKYGQLGGNNVRAQLRNPGAANQALSVTVTPNAAGEADIIVNLATNSSNAITSTAAQVVSAINGSAAAAPYVRALVYGGTTGTGTVAARALVNLTDGPLNAPTTGSNAVPRGPFQMKVLRIGADVGKSPADSHHVGVYLFCQQHAREWVTGITCAQTAEQLLRNYATDARTKELLDNLDIFILPGANPDGINYSMYDFASQRKNMTNYCAQTTANGMPTNRNTWGVDQNRNGGEYSLFDGYFGASTNCTSETYAGPSEYSEPESKNLSYIMDTYSNIKFANNVHTYGGYFMWAPGSYTGNGRVSAPPPNIGIEGYFFAAADTVLQRIKDVRGTTVLPERTGPIADVLYSAAGNGADEAWYHYGIIGYSFEAGSDRFSSTSSGTSQSAVGFQPTFSSEGRFEAQEFAAGNYGLLESALAYAQDHTAPTSTTVPAGPVASKTPVDVTFKWGNEPSVIRYTLDGSTPTLASTQWNRQGPRRPGTIFTFNTTTTVKWIATDIVGNTSEVQSARFAVETVPPTTTASLAPAAQNGFFRHPTVSLLADDNFAGGGSGVDFTQYRVDGGALTTYSAPFDVTGDGSHTVQYFSTDLAGNVEATKSTSFLIDDTAPTTSFGLAPPPTAGFYHDPTVTLTADDGSGVGSSGVASISYSVDGGATQTYIAPFQVTGDGSHTVDYYATDAAGNTEATKSESFAIDTTAPTSGSSLAPAPVNGFYASNPTVTLTAGDGSGAGSSGVDVISYLLDEGTFTDYSGSFVVTGDGSHTLQFHAVDKAGNVEAIQTVSFMIDTASPVITLASPAAGGQYLLDSAVAAQFGCTNVVSPVASCLGTVPSGSTFDTASVGFKTFTVASTNLAGHSSSLTHQYNVYWPFGGFKSPIDPAKVNVAQAGSAIPVKFSLGGNRGLGIMAAGYPKVNVVACDSSLPSGVVDETVTPGSSTLSYSSDHYQYVWKTEKSWAGTCRELVVKLVDNTVHTASFRFK